MSDATISRIVVALNRENGSTKHFSLGVEGMNLGANTTVTAKYVKGGKTYNWEAEVIHVHSPTLLAVKLKRKESDPDKEKGAPVSKQIEQITVTVSNPGQRNPASKDVPALIVEI